MKITIKAKDGENICFTVSPSDSVNELKTKIQEKEKLLNQQQHLIYDGESLNDEHSLSDYKIQEGSILLMVNKERSLLLKSSIIFDNSSLLDRIHQSNIDLKNEPQEEDVLNLLNEAISYLDEDLKPNVAVELFFLISNCFMQYPDQCFKLFNKRFQKGKITANHIIAFAEVLSDLAIYLPNVSIKDHEDFINNSFQQIQKSTDDTLTIFGNEIPQHFKNIFISDIILLLEPTDKIVLKFSQNIINEENSATKVNYFIRNVGKCGLIKLIPDSLFIENSYFTNLTSENKILLLQLSTEQSFRKFIPLIIDSPFNGNRSSLCLTILNKLMDFDISDEWYMINACLITIDNIKLTKKHIKYFEKHHIKLPKTFAPKIFPKDPIYLKLFLDPKELPEDYVSYALMEANELSIYKEAFFNFSLLTPYDINSPVISTIDFWKHIMLVILNSDEELDNKLISRFAFYFQNYINPQQFDSFFDHLIFDEDSLPNEKQSLFLLKLLENIGYNYLNFTNDRLKKFLKKKEIPCKTLCSLFSFHEYPMNNPTSLELYIFVFSKNKDNLTYTLNLNINYEPILAKVYHTFKYYINKVLWYGTNEDDDQNEILTQFIKQNNDISLIKDFTEKIFKFIAASLFYVGENRPFDCKGLTKENALPFYAIALNHIDEQREVFFTLSGQNFLKWSSKEMLDALIESIKCLENCTSALLNESINAILSKGPRISAYDCIQLKTIFDILCDFCIKGSYQADKIQFINIVFYFSCTDENNLNMKPYILIIQKYGIHLFNFILQHKAELINTKRLFYLCLSLFNIDEIKNSFENEIKKSTSDADLYQTIFFYVECCREYPILKVDKVTNIKRIFEQFVEEEKWDDFYTTTVFMLYNQIDVNFEIIKEKKIPINVFTKLMQIPNYRNIDNYLFQILSNPELENNYSVMIYLFDFIIQDKSVLYKYITANLEIISINTVISYEMILQLKPRLYALFKEDLIFVLKNSFDFDQQTKQFIKKINAKLPEKFSESECSIIEKLYETKSYQSFICLHYIASCFPFLFDPDTSSNNKSHYIKAVDIVLPALNCLSFIYDDQNTEDKTNNLKTAIAALSFLYSCLNSTKFFSIFILWLFENISSLTESQIIFMSTILHLLLCNSRVRIFILGYAIKYNFLDIMNDLLLRDIPNKEFKSFYIHTLYNLLADYLSLISSSYINENILFIDGIKNGSIPNPFVLWFNYSSVTPVYIKKLEFTFPSKDEINELIKEFTSKINPNISLWISTKFNKELNENEISDFLSFFKGDEKSTFIKEKLPSIPSKKTIRTQRYLISHPSWIFDIIDDNNQNFPITLEHYEYLTKLINKLNEISDESKDNSTEEDAEVLDNYNLYDWFNNQICPIKLFRTVLDYHLYSEKIDDISTKLLDFLSNNSKYRKYFHQLVNETLLQIETKFPLKPRVFYYRILHFFAILFGKDRDNDEYIFQGGGNKFFEYFLSPFNLKLVNYTAKYLSILNCELPIQSTHIIGYIYAFNPSGISYALDLLSKLDEEKVKNIIPIIKNEYKKELKSDHLNYNNLSHYLKGASFIAKNDSSFFNKCLIKCINKYKNDETKDANLRDFIIELFNFLAPKRDKYQIEYSPRSDEIDFTTSIFDRDQMLDDDIDDKLYHTPEQFFQQGSSFWENVYERYFKFLCEILKEDDKILEKLTFLHDYYELVPFKSRSKYFKDQIKSFMENKKTIDIIISRSNVLRDTFGQFCEKNPKDLIGLTYVKFIGEKGIDDGGLTSEYFSLITKEIFNPNFGLFIKNENNCYHPNPLSYINENYIQYFKLAGEIIALALLNNQFVDAHFSMAFYRQILHQKIKIKDLEDFDKSLYDSLQAILDADDASTFGLVFEINDDQFGKTVSIDLIENGSEIDVTNDNRYEYVSLYANYKLRKSIIDQVTAFCDAFDEIIPQEYIRMFSPSELDLLICGIPHIDLEDMRKHTFYDNPYHDQHPTIIMFFKVLSKWSQEDLGKFLIFLTGSSQVPVNGFKYFEDCEKPIKIISGGDKFRYPVAHTCSRVLELPEYDNENDMNRKLMSAINCCDFGIL